jgi:hypothetical protein
VSLSSSPQTTVRTRPVSVCPPGCTRATCGHQRRIGSDLFANSLMQIRALSFLRLYEPDRVPATIRPESRPCSTVTSVS